MERSEQPSTVSRAGCPRPPAQTREVCDEETSTCEEATVEVTEQLQLSTGSWAKEPAIAYNDGYFLVVWQEGSGSTYDLM